MTASSTRTASSPGDDNATATEQTPLLSSDQLSSAGDTATAIESANGSSRQDSRGRTSKNPDDDDKPLPRTQIFLLCYARLMEPIAFFSIFPYIAEMVQRNGHLPESDVGFYSGLIESLFSATQMIVLIAWGRIADRFGRKPVLLASFIGMALGPSLFGMSTSILQMILSRCLAGVFSGSSLVIRTMVSEHSTPETQALAFSWFAFAGNLGIFIGPIVGGALADPATQYPRVFAGIPFFENYPYALAGFAVAGLSMTAAITSILFLEETLPEKRPGAPTQSQTGGAENVPSVWELLRAPNVGIVLWIYNHALLLAFTFTAILPVALYTAVDLGGLGFGTSLITAYMAIQGASQSIWLLIAFPFLQKRMGTKGILKACGVVYPFFFAGYIVLNLLLRDGTHASMVVFWILGFLVAFIGPGVAMSFTAVQLALNDVSPDPHVLGTLNAIALTASSAIRAVAPGVSTALFAVGVRNHILGGHLAWVVLIPLAAAMRFVAGRVPEGKKPHRATENDDTA